MTVDRAMLLAAGFGTRLRPITLSVPKPLLPLGEVPLIDHQLRYLAVGGIRKVMINLHYLGGKIRAHVGDGGRFGLAVSYSEEEAILGTGGGIKKAETFFEGRAFVALNADALLDADIGEVARRHVEGRAAATMVVKALGPGDGHTPIDVGSDGKVKGFGKGRFFYTGLQVLGPEMLSVLPPAGKPSSLIDDGYRPLLERGDRVSAFVHAGYAGDLGAPESYERARKDVAAGIFALRS